ncbi:MarR family transcriptional regulator [Streptomyces sp. NPDC047976]|uniref:MarR family transcriptional regulator n=1 Tax=Streptomyces sp. NPDC047976 TaxID=3155746 RepID=UPI003441BA09
MTTTASTLNSRVIALAHHAARALAEGVLDRHGITFHQSVTLRAVTVAGGSVPRGELVAEIQNSLKTTETLVQAVIEELLTAGLLAREDSLLRLTGTGRDLYETTAAATAEVSARLYAGIAAEDLAVAGRVLTLITDRANTELGTD